MAALTLSQNLEGEPTEETLDTLYKKKCKALSQATDTTEFFDFLMNSMQCVKEGNMEAMRQDLVVQEKPKVKNLRQAPCTAPYVPMDLCKGCGKDEVIDDVPMGQYVCVACGLIQQQGVFTGDTAHCSQDRLKNGSRVNIHRYSRIVHFVSVLRSLQGESCPVVSTATLTRLRAALAGRSPSVKNVAAVLREEGLSARYRRHINYFVKTFGGTPQLQLPLEYTLPLKKKFRQLEFWYDLKHKSVWKGRRVFFSYTFVLYYFLQELGIGHLGDKTMLLQCPVRQQRQLDAYNSLKLFMNKK